jgi:hypothetical protein
MYTMTIEEYGHRGRGGNQNLNARADFAVSQVGATTFP